MAQVFISYSRQDLAFVEQLASDLKAAGFDVWYDMSGISGGAAWKVAIEQALRNSQFVVVVLSPESVASEWVDREFLFASQLNLKIIPLMYRACELSLNYVNLNYIDVQGLNYQKHFHRLLHALSETTQPVPVPGPTTDESFSGWRNRYLLSGAIVAAILLGGFSLWWLNGNRGSPESTITPMISQPAATRTPTSTTVPYTQTVTITITTTPKPTATKEPGYAIMAPDDVWEVASSLRTLGQLAVEKYSVEERNQMNNTLTFTVNSTTETPILWRWFWCAVNDRVLEQNMTRIGILFDADGYAIPEEQLATIVFENADPTYEGWKCRTYQTVLHDWKPGTYTFTQTMTIASPINDGKDKFEAGYKIYEYTVNIAPE
mgnify:CR=1 FL=1